MLRSLGLGATFALAASSFLIPVDEAATDASLETLDARLGLVNPQTQLLTVNCPGCLYATTEAHTERLVWTEGVHNSLLLNFSVGAAPETLELNGVRFYPPRFMSLSNVLRAYQFESSVSLSDIRAHPEEYLHALDITTYAMNYAASQTIEEGYEILPITLSIYELEGKGVNLPTISLTAVKDSEGKLMLLSIMSESTELNPVEDTEPDKECTRWPLLCKWRNVAEDKMEDIKHAWSDVFKSIGNDKKPCHKGKPGMTEVPHGRPHHMPGKPPHTMRPPMEADKQEMEHHQDGMMHKHTGIHRVFHMFMHAMITVFVPILVGVAAGMATYLIGMLIGCTIAVAYLKFRAWRRGEYLEVRLDEENAPAQDYRYSRGSLDKEDWVPEYQETEDMPPEYEDVEKEVVVPAPTDDRREQ